jgi:uncharacterized protein
MNRPRIIIDGYNLLHKIPDIARLVDTDLERARDLLVSRLVGYRAQKNARITVVFDGRGPQALPQGGRSATGVEVVFSRAPENADARIKSIITKEKNPRSCTVVTSDNSIRIHVRDFGAKVMASAEFAQELSGRGKGTRSETRGGLRSGTAVKRAQRPGDMPEMSASEIAEWEEYFRAGRAD